MSFAAQITASLSPKRYLLALGFAVYLWQEMVLNPALKRVCLLCSRQSGKSTVVAGYALWRAKYFPKSEIIIIAPTERQAQETMAKIKTFKNLDPDLCDLKSDSKHEMILPNGSRILALPGSSARGYSAPDVVIIDEASQVPDEVYLAVRPMMTANPNAVMFLLSTPFGKEGFFYEACHRPEVWTRFQVRPAFDLSDTGRGYQVIDALESEEIYRERLLADGINAFYSPHHTKEWLTEELFEIGSWGWKQEYGLEFLDTVDAALSTDDILAMFQDNIREFRGDYQDDEITGEEDEVPAFEFSA